MFLCGECPLNNVFIPYLSQDYVLSMLVKKIKVQNSYLKSQIKNIFHKITSKVINFAFKL